MNTLYLFFRGIFFSLIFSGNNCSSKNTIFMSFSFFFCRILLHHTSFASLLAKHICNKRPSALYLLSAFRHILPSNLMKGQVRRVRTHLPQLCSHSFVSPNSLTEFPREFRLSGISIGFPFKNESLYHASLQI